MFHGKDGSGINSIVYLNNNRKVSIRPGITQTGRLIEAAVQSGSVTPD